MHDREEIAKKIKELEKNSLKKINQPIRVSELVVNYPPGDSSKGESHLKSSPHDSRNRIDRLAEHIRILAEIAEKYHEEKYFEGGDIKEDALNHITRLSLNEFALYTKDTPLTEDELNLLVSKIQVIAKNCHQNVHLALGTVAVGVGESLKNISIYVQGGDFPKMHLSTKSHPSEMDVQYNGFKVLDRSSLKEEYTKAEEGIAAAASGSINDSEEVKKGTGTNYNSIFITETAGGAKAIIGVDICLDHDKAHVKKAFEDQLESTINNKDVINYFPQQRSHVVISNPITFDYEKVISEKVVHADPQEGGLSTRAHVKQSSVTMDSENYTSISGIKTKVSIVNGNIAVTNPPFGSDYHIVAYPEHSLTLSDSDLEIRFKDRIDKTNESMMEERVKAALASRETNVSLTARAGSADFKNESKEVADVKMQVDDDESSLDPDLIDKAGSIWVRVGNDLKSINKDTYLAIDQLMSLLTDQGNTLEKQVACKEVGGVLKEICSKLDKESAKNQRLFDNLSELQEVLGKLGGSEQSPIDTKKLETVWIKVSPLFQGKSVWKEIESLVDTLLNSKDSATCFNAIQKLEYHIDNAILSVDADLISMKSRMYRENLVELREMLKTTDSVKLVPNR